MRRGRSHPARCQGLLYGTTSRGGAYCTNVNGCGTVFSITTSGNETPLYSFSGKPNGAYPEAPLLYSKGKLFGTTVFGGNPGCRDGCGTIFSLSL